MDPYPFENLLLEASEEALSLLVFMPLWNAFAALSMQLRKPTQTPIIYEGSLKK